MGASDADQSDVFAEWGTEYISDGRVLRGYYIAPDDFHLTPTYVLGGELAAAGKAHEVRVYGPIGAEHGNGHAVFNNAVDLWAPDVRRFLARWMP